VTVAVELPPDDVEDPTVHSAVVEELKVTTPPEVVLAEMAKVCAVGVVTLSPNSAKEIVFSSPTNTFASTYIVAPKYPPPLKS
jgi:hypothetical protein